METHLGRRPAHQKAVCREAPAIYHKVLSLVTPTRLSPPFPLSLSFGSFCLYCRQGLVIPSLRTSTVS